MNIENMYEKKDFIMETRYMNMKKLIFLVIFLLLTITVIYATVPNEIAYQGRIREYGVLVNGTRNIKLAIYKTETGGTNSEYEQYYDNEPVVNGIFNVVITPNIDLRGKDFWIETSIEGKALNARKKIMADFYALHSNTAEGLSVKDGKDIKFKIGDNEVIEISDSGIVNKVNGVEFYMVPKGAIIMWYGSIANIPAGWTLCNGTNGTPDLRDRFIVGAGSSYEVGNTGGANQVALTTAQLPAHSHTGTTASAGAHSHIQGFWMENISGTLKNDVGVSGGSQRNAGVSGGSGVSGRTDSDGNHTHTFTTNNTGSGEAHENRPPYYALAYIMKM